ncbi:sensor histidine kinase [Haloechinothrix salitolerans]|uniref:histidine kinase n=1 Tax=Haloechinothrix salitolerans TaxID=926830 RepID=A0ABW2C927_9PSEU
MTQPAGSSRPHVMRRVGAVCVTVLVVSLSIFSSLMVLVAEGFVPGSEDIEPGWRGGLGALLAIGAAVGLVWRHRHPEFVTAAAVLPPLVFITDSLAALIALAALAAARRDYVLWIGTAAVYVATAIAVGYDARRHVDYSMVQIFAGAQTEAERVDAPLFAILLIAAVMTAIPLAVGVLRGTRRDLTRSTHAERELSGEMARREERTRIAREMHDVLGHRLSLLSLQAGALEVSDDHERAAEVARGVRGTAKEALNDLREVVGVLRDGRTFSGGSTPSGSDTSPRTLADLPELLDNSRRAGLAMNVTVLLDDVSIAPAPLGSAAYRIVQEALTNVLRHAPDTTADVTIRGSPGVGLSIEVSNPLRGDSETVAGAGTGLHGVAERVAQLGGTVSSGPTDADTFVLAAWLPWSRDRDGGEP